MTTTAQQNAAASFPGMLAVGHAGLLIVFLSWKFGGMDPSGRMVAACLCAVAPFVTILAWRQAERSLRRRFLGITLPLGLIAALVLTSAFNPSMRVLTSGGEAVGLIPRDDVSPYLPSTALPSASVSDFLLNAGLVLVGLNLFLARPTRNLQRGLLGIIAANAGVLACLGTAFKLLHAKQILGTFRSPNENFFATFFYYNHWGAFALLGAAAAGALAFQYRDRSASSGGWENTPAPALGVVALISLFSLPLSGSRASTAAGLVLALLLAYRLVPVSRGGRTRRRQLLLSVLAVLVVLGAGSYWLARDKLQFIAKKTSSQVTELRSGGIGDARLAIYRATLHLYRERPIFGWGWRSFRYAFRQSQTFDLRMHNEQREKTYVIDAHNDWLQFLAEMGTVGTVLALAAVAGIARAASLRRWRFSPSFELVGGLLCVCLMACVDFPFACPAVVVTFWSLLATAAAIAFDRDRGSSSA